MHFTRFYSFPTRFFSILHVSYSFLPASSRCITYYTRFCQALLRYGAVFSRKRYGVMVTLKKSPPPHSASEGLRNKSRWEKSILTLIPKTAKSPQKNTQYPCPCPSMRLHLRFFCLPSWYDSNMTVRGEIHIISTEWVELISDVFMQYYTTRINSPTLSWDIHTEPSCRCCISLNME